jgi:excinuclease UvrABC nuclease subunit
VPGGAYWRRASSLATAEPNLMAPRAPAAVTSLPGTPGVYRFRDSGGRVLYIGRATALRSRVGSYWSDLRDRSHLAPMVARVARIEAVSCDSPHEAAWLERNLLETSMPAWNRTPGGQESTVYIRLDGRPAGPGLTVEHLRQPAGRLRYFGPYLGGLRVRQAVAGLDRILPLGYAGTRLRGARLDLARARGHGDADRDALISAITAVLDRQTGAVAWAGRELDRLRDGAAETLAFELAARIHAERQALDWVTSPQRVTTMAAADADVYGWAGGVLVHFAVRGGRLREWSQRRCGRDRAGPRLAGSPAGWAGFARRNAELAAALAPGGITRAS